MPASNENSAGLQRKQPSWVVTVDPSVVDHRQDHRTTSQQGVPVNSLAPLHTTTSLTVGAHMTFVRHQNNSFTTTCATTKSSSRGSSMHRRTTFQYPSPPSCSLGCLRTSCNLVRPLPAGHTTKWPSCFSRWGPCVGAPLPPSVPLGRSG